MTAEVTAMLRAMINSCKDLKKNFDNDREHFSKQAFDAFATSDTRKLELLNQIHANFQTLLNTHLADFKGTLMEKIASYSQQLAPAQQSLVTQLTHSLQIEISHCLQLMAVNSKIIYANLEFIRQFYDKVSHKEESNPALYDQSGHIRK